MAQTPQLMSRLVALHGVMEKKRSTFVVFAGTAGIPPQYLPSVPKMPSCSSLLLGGLRFHPQETLLQDQGGEGGGGERGNRCCLRGLCGSWSLLCLFTPRLSERGAPGL